MYQLYNNPILQSHQIIILKAFFTASFGQPFFLTGGTALSAFYLAHRDSKDLDLFTMEELDLVVLENTIREIAEKTKSKVITKVRSNSYCEIYLQNKKQGWVQRIDIVKEIPKHFGKIETMDGIRVDSLENIGSNKILAIFGRLEIKDYVDLYLILRETKLTFTKLFKLAQQKDMGLFEFYFANIIRACVNFETFPVMKVPFNRAEFVKFYSDLSRDLLLKIKPRDQV